MPNYRRAHAPGGTFFFTVSLQEPGSNLLIDHIDDLRWAFASVLRDAPVHCAAVVVLPDHLHAIWTLPPGDTDFPNRWRKIKRTFTRAIPPARRPTARSASKVNKREAGIWQRRYWEHMIRDDEDYHAFRNFCWTNPMRHGLVREAVDWPYSSLHRDRKAGLAPNDLRLEPMVMPCGERDMAA
ncbi:REP-associated tyrosine transposase [Pseudaestuariivita sp.]|uniref:REP-associated tyrosine transposase n=1 Tax=Pseudaestuariivita sp. TaxID=2211669 RepID=UPI0040590304